VEYLRDYPVPVASLLVTTLTVPDVVSDAA
jgi:hypothetical protein